METEITQPQIKPPEITPPEITSSELSQPVTNRNTALYIILAIFSAFLLYYSVMSLLSPARKISEINSGFGYKQPEKITTPPGKQIFSDSAFVNLNREKAFYQARIIMAATDSISLALNLTDSSAILEIKGVAVHEAKITRKNISKVFNKADEYAISSMLSTPFTVKNDFATIRREPLMLKIAPKDTSEYQPDILPDTTSSEPVNYMLEMDNGFRLYVYQDVGKKTGGRLSRFLFDINDRLKNSWNIIKSICVLKIPEYHPYIKIRLPKDDAKIIYRALPRHGQIAVYR